MKISLILPTFNNAKSLKAGLELIQVHNLFGELDYEIIIIDDGSSNSNLIKTIANDNNCRYLRHLKNLGKGASLRYGVEEAIGEFIIFTDSDMPFSLRSMRQSIKLILSDQYDLVVGDRKHMKFNKNNSSILRFLSSKLFNMISTTILGLSKHDSQCGLKCFKAKSAKIIFTEIVVNRFSIDAEIIYRAIKLEMKINSIPVDIVNNGKSSLYLFRDGSIMLLDLFRIKIFSMKRLNQKLGATNKARFICDDYGLNESTNKAILELARSNKICGTSVMVTHITRKDLNDLKNIKNINIGLHLNLTEGEPITNIKLIPSLLNNAGTFCGLKHLIIRIITKKLKEEEILLELKAQINLFKYHFTQVHHIDGHQHIQYLPILASILNNVKSELGLDATRLRLGFYCGNIFGIKTFLLNVLAFFVRKNSKFQICKYLLDYNSVLDKTHPYKNDTEYMLHVAHPNLHDPSMDLTSFNWRNRVRQFEKKKSENLIV